ncbi:hypothetical protein BEP19_02770 [Ammoniphilus oxalaticus]|uniref:DnaA N-terminal domain-containing protein n=1 Tax=Ammoniphilus oxalaticus TaxID=66863 RepID=A0A419SNQ5_9BACL|nr:DnaA N-terminal domain-containing protein [Ammoniphilus oxalaticus]RKD25872.1 hypothetical protein BEP19_02770 [Ammoniphilus oxalaticus]
MIAMNAEQLWSIVLSNIKESGRLAVPSYETWIQKTSVQMENETLIVFAQSEFQRDWLEVRYAELIRDEVLQVANQEITDIVYRSLNLPADKNEDPRIEVKISSHHETEDNDRKKERKLASYHQGIREQKDSWDKEKEGLVNLVVSRFQRKYGAMPDEVIDRIMKINIRTFFIYVSEMIQDLSDSREEALDYIEQYFKIVE